MMDLDKIIKSSLPKAEQSKEIMARLREEYIFAKKSYIDKFVNASYATIAPYSDDADDVKPELEERDIEGTEDNEYSRIHANSFGPFNPDEYFKNGNFKILWVLKEPFVEYGEYEDLMSCLRKFLGGHDQGKQYWDEGWSVIKLPAEKGGNPTIANLIRISKMILKELGEPFNGNDEDAIMKQVMGHICILEVNHFPGLAFNSKISKNSLIGDWAEINNDLIQELIAFYNPNVIIGGNTLGHFYPDGYKLIGEGNTHSFDHIKEGIKNGNEMFKILGLTILKDETNYMQVRKDYLFKTKEGIILVDSSHPSRYSKVQSEENGKQIKHWSESETQIKVTKS